MSKAQVDKHLKSFEIEQRQVLENLREMIAAELHWLLKLSSMESPLS